ncbi:MAG TPA: outer membrane beta-barrel protein [Acidiphilium sp.]
MARRRRTARISVVLAGIGCALLAQGVGRTQSLGDLFPIAVPGYAEAPGVTARSRLHPDDVPAGIAVPGTDFMVYPGFDAGAGFDTAPADDAGGSAFGRIRPDLRIADDALGLAGFAAADLTRYVRGGAADTRDVTAALGFGIPFGPDRITLGVARASVAESGLGLAQSGGAAPFRAVVDDGRIALRLRFGMVDATERFGVEHETLNAAGDVTPGFRDRTVLHESSEVETAPGGVLRFLILLKAAQARYRGAVPGDGFGNSASVAALGGIETDAASLWRLRVLAGAIRQNLAGEGSRIAPVFDIGLGWTPDGLVAVEFDASREAGLAASLGTPGTEVTSLDVAAADAWRRDLLLTADMAMRMARIAGRPAREIDVETGAAWHWSRAFAIEPRLHLALRHDLPGSPPFEVRATVFVVWTP